MCKISNYNSKRLLRKQQKNFRGLLSFAAPCRVKADGKPMNLNMQYVFILKVFYSWLCIWTVCTRTYFYKVHILGHC